MICRLVLGFKNIDLSIGYKPRPGRKRRSGIRRAILPPRTPMSSTPKILTRDNDWGRECVAYHLQARPDAATIHALRDCQHLAAGRLPTELHTIPPEALHCTVFTLIPAATPMQKARRDWEGIEPLLAISVSDWRLEGPVSLRFERLAFTPTAVIVATDSVPAEIQKTRRSLSALLQRANLPFPVYDLAHVTVARYAATHHVDGLPAGSLDPVVIDVGARFEEIRLVRERRYPSLDIEVLRLERQGDQRSRQPNHDGSNLDKGWK